MNLATARNRALAAALAVAGLVALYWGALRTGFLADDYLFLEEARARGLSSIVVTSGGIANYFRPLSREVWFGLLTPPFGHEPLLFHAASLALFVLALVLVFDLLRALAPLPGAAAGTLYFAVLPLQRVNLEWISCSQDLLALVGALAALAAWRRGRDRLALLAAFVALLSKESALPLPLLLAAWSRFVAREDGARTLRRLAPFALPLAAWAVGEAWLRAHATAAAKLAPGLSPLLATFVHLAQSLAGLESPAHLPAAFASTGPSVIALALLAPLAAWLPDAPAPGATATARGAVPFALAWAFACALPVVPVAYNWSAYYYTLAAVGGAVLVARLAERLSRWGFVALVLGGLWWHAAASAIPVFAVTDDPWTWTSHLTPGYFDRGAELSGRLRTALARVAPHPAPGTRFFFATLPPFAGFQMGNGAAIRHDYGDPTLRSFFYSQFSDSTAGDHPCVFLFWNGVDFVRLDALSREPYFQAGSDLLLLGANAGALHAFRRGAAAHELPPDIAYWTGWAMLWSGDRAGAERAWLAFGAKDDTLAYRDRLLRARDALGARDTLAARRLLFEAIHAGIGRPEAHAELGALLSPSNAKFGLLETLVAARLDPADLVERRDLVTGLVSVHLDEVARRELVALKQDYPEWRGDPEVVRVDQLLTRRAPGAGGEMASTGAHAGVGGARR